MSTKHILLFEKFNSPIEVWHGSDVEIETFDTKYLGSGAGHDQEGPGFYFTDNKKDAAFYGKPQKYLLNLKKVVPLKGQINERHVREMIKNAPDLEDKLSNWGENQKYAFEKAVETVMDMEDPHNAFQQIWYDFYRHDQPQYVQNMSKLGYDGVIVPRPYGVTHYIVFSPDTITKVKNEAFKPKHLENRKEEALKRGIILMPSKIKVDMKVKFKKDNFYHTVDEIPDFFHYNDNIEVLQFDLDIKENSVMFNKQYVDNSASFKMFFVETDNDVRVDFRHIMSIEKIIISEKSIKDISQYVAQKFMWNEYEDKKENGTYNLSKIAQKIKSEEKDLIENIEKAIKNHYLVCL